MTSAGIDDSASGLTLPLEGDAAEPWMRRHRTGVRVAMVVAALVTSAVVGAAVIPVPYYALSPGSARPVSEQVLVEGVPSYKPEESIAFTTVNVGPTTLLEALVGWLDADVDVIPEDKVLGDRSQAQNQRYNAQLMDSSKQVAITVALEHLGYDVPIRTTGTVVREILRGAPADGVLERDDVIVAVDGNLVDEPGEIGSLLQPGGPGATHELSIERPAGTTSIRKVPVTTVAAKDDPARAMIGIDAEDRIVGFDFPIDVTIDSGNVGGPSAGLAFTLALLDVLTPGEITGGHRVAVTGTISLDGKVGPVGGGAQKAIAVRDDGYEVFLVPSDELAEVRATVGDDLRVIPVDTLAEALEALASLGGNAGSLRRSG
ncbi:MAG: YlbL family protein [Microthrixaceae bacterium]